MKKQTKKRRRKPRKDQTSKDFYSKSPAEARLALSALLLAQLLEAVAPQAPRESHGSRAAEDSVPAEERQKGRREEEGSGSRSEDCCQGCPRPHMPCLQDTDARPKDIQAAF
ncbi:hypothetical protein AOLI_G00304000 [Acnodon oligacanthus]